MKARPLIASAIIIAACARADDSAIGTDTVSGTTIDSAPSIPQGRDTAASLTCGVTGTPVLTEQGIGELKQGRPAGEIAALCEVLSDSEQRGQEGSMERVMVLRIAGETIRAVVADGRIFRIQVSTPRFRTADSLGVDTPLRRIASMRGAQFAPGEDGVYGFSPDHCGLSFRFSLPWRPPAGGQWTAEAISREHGNAAVNRVIVIPCSR